MHSTPKGQERNNLLICPKNLQTNSLTSLENILPLALKKQRTVIKPAQYDTFKGSALHKLAMSAYKKAVNVCCFKKEVRCYQTRESVAL